MRFYIAFDDTDTLDCGRGTGKLARWFTEELPRECITWGVVRQQLLHAPGIPMTSHNSSLCCVVDAPDASYRQLFIEQGPKHIARHFFEGSDPGFCVAGETDPGMDELIAFGIKCTHTKVTQAEAMEAARHIHLSGHGGSNDGIIGAAAAVGLTHFGESGRLVEYRDIRTLPTLITAEELRRRGISPVSVNRHAEFIPGNHTIDTQDSLRPHLNGKRLIVPLLATGNTSWKTIDERKAYSEE